MMLGVSGKRNAKRSSIPYLDCVCGLMWVGLPGRECPDWLVEGGKKAWLRNLSFLEYGFSGKVLNCLNGTVVVGQWHCESRHSIGCTDALEAY
ncbi:hypothetical protein TNCV_4366501 [Trichonephila clavipes]|nr:hypothetical protein TNCV_4366501 [Trichonephila clavipes]